MKAACSVAALMTLAAGSMTSSAAEPTSVRDVEFAVVDGHSLKLDLYLPDESRNSPLVVWIHGGGWRGGSKDKCSLKWLAEHGYCVASISYRLTDKAIFPAQIHDCKAAVRWLRANSGMYGFRTDKIAVAGSSAGGHLAALVGTSGDVKALEGTVGGNLDQSSRVDAVVDFYGATDFILRSKTQPHRANQKGSVVYLLLGGGADQKTDLARLASAAFHVTSDDPPFLVFHGSKDRTVLPDQSQRIHEVYTQAGLPIDLHVLEGAGHGGDVFYSGPRRDVVLSFLKKHLVAADDEAGAADDSAIARQLEALGGTVRTSDGFVTEVSFRNSRQLGNAEWRAIGKLSQLKKLTAYGGAAGLNDDTVDDLTNLQQLETLSVDGGQLSDDGLKKLAALKKLKAVNFFHLSFRKEGFTGAGFAAWSALPELESLTVAGMSMGDEGFAAIGTLKGLKQLRTWHTYRTEASNREIAKLPRLMSLKLGQRLPRGKGAPLSLSNESLPVIAGMQTLESLEVGEADFRVDALKVLAKLPHLKRLKIDRTWLSAADIERLQPTLPNVTIDFQPVTDEQRSKLEAYLRQ